jgi:hypothetical protein
MNTTLQIIMEQLREMKNDIKGKMSTGQEELRNEISAIRSIHTELKQKL